MQADLRGEAPVRSAGEEIETSSVVKNDFDCQCISSLISEILLWARGVHYTPAVKATVVQTGANKASNQIT